MESPSKQRRLLGLKGCNAALQSGFFARTIGAEFQGLRKEIELWTPKTWGELFDAYRRVWQLLESKLDSMEKDEQEKAIEILISQGQVLGVEPNLAGFVAESISKLSQKSYVKKEKIISSVVQTLRYGHERLNPESIRIWERARDNIIGIDFTSQLRRYIGMDFIDYVKDAKGEYVDQAQPKIEELAEKAIENNELLKDNLVWLIVTDTQNCYRFGYELGKRDKDLSSLKILLEAQRPLEQNSIPFLGGYFRFIFEGDQTKWENLLDALASDPKLVHLIPELTWRSGISDKAILRIIRLLKENVIKTIQLRMFFYNIQKLSENVFNQFIETLLKYNDNFTMSIILELYNIYYLNEKTIKQPPEDITFRVLTKPDLFRSAQANTREVMNEYYWSLIAKLFIGKYPNRSLAIANQLFRYSGEYGAST